MCVAIYMEVGSELNFLRILSFLEKGKFLTLVAAKIGWKACAKHCVEISDDKQPAK